MNRELFEALQQQILSDERFIDAKEIPKIDLYMDQVTTFMDEHLSTFRTDASEKTLTKTMINNYAKSNLLPPPIKKKYSKDHMLTLISIYHLKNILSITDIQTLLGPVNEHYFGADGELNLEAIYREIASASTTPLEETLQQIDARYRQAESLFTKQELSDEERLILERYAFVNMLSYEITIRQRMINAVIQKMEAEAKEKAEQKAALKAAEKAAEKKNDKKERS